MLKKYSHLFEGVFAAVDLIVASASWLIAYYLRFHTDLFTVEKGIPPFEEYTRMLVFVWIIWAFVYRKFGLYKPMRGVSLFRELWSVVQANAMGVVLLLAATYLFREKSTEFSRLVFVLFFSLSVFTGVISRWLIRKSLRFLRKKGHNLRHALIVGSGDLASDVARRINAHPEYGIELVGCLSEDEHDDKYKGSLEVVDLPKFRAQVGNRYIPTTHYSAKSVAAPSPAQIYHLDFGTQPDESIPIIGSFTDLPELLAKGVVDQIIVAMPLSDHGKIPEVMSAIGDSMVDVRIVPDLRRFIQLGSSIEEFDGLPVVGVVSTPLVGVSKIFKRIFDIFFASIFFVASIPLFVTIAFLVKLNSRGPVFFSQERVGLDGREFRILKFRTMSIDAESGGAQFAVKNDPRVTKIGRILRKFSLDEIPQLVNVLMGQMSLVGPRPERAVFIDEFRKEIPKYMLRHRVQAGMTGWAQINGWRGNTSVERRIEHDLYYIENWSLLLDLKILFSTFFIAVVDKNAY